jgi:hypothetical protein
MKLSLVALDLTVVFSAFVIARLESRFGEIGGIDEF